MSMVVYGRERLDAARRAGYADGKASGRSEGHTEGRAAERADVVAWLKGIGDGVRMDIGGQVVSLRDVADLLFRPIENGAHVGAAKKGGGT